MGNHWQKEMSDKKFLKRHLNHNNVSETLKRVSTYKNQCGRNG